MSFAPSARMRSILACGAVSIATTVHGHARLARRIGHALPRVAGADRPHAARALAPDSMATALAAPRNL